MAWCPVPERHLGHDDHLHRRGRRGVERRTDREPPVDLDGGEIAFPQRVPVLRLDTYEGGAFDAAAGQQRIHFAFASGQPFAGNVGFEPCALLLEALEGEVGQFGRKDLRLSGIGGVERQFDIIHIM